MTTKRLSRYVASVRITMLALHQLLPDLEGERTMEEGVVDGFLILCVKNANIGSLLVPFHKVIPC